MLLPRSLLAAAALAAAATAQTMVLPQSAATVGGSSANSFPWGTPGTLWPGLRVMCIYDSSHFTAASVPITSPILITSISWRANDVATSTSWAGGTYGSATLRLATAAVDHSLATTNFAANLGPDQVVVHNGPVTVNGGSGAGVGVPGAWHVTIPVVPPFLYNPNAGDLVVDTDYLSPGNYVGGSQVMLDLETPLAGTRVYASTSYPGADGIDDGCPVIQIGYAPSGGTPATNTGLGTGCIRSHTSFYELLAAPGFDLDHTVLTMIPTGPGGHLVVNSVGALLPVGSIAPPVVLALGDDAEVTQTFTTGSFPGASSFTICSNGFVSLGSNGTSFNPDVAALLGAPNTAWRSWHDFDPSAPGSGQVKYEESAAAIVVTWDGVWDFGGTSPANANTMQMQFLPTGQVTLAWGTLSHLGNSHLVGYSPGGASLDPGATDLSALGASVITLGGTDALPLLLTAVTRPVLGTSWNLTTSQIPATGVIGVDLFGTADPGMLDLSFLGLPGCQLRSTLDVVVGPWPVGGATHNYSIAVPAAPTSLIGVQLFTQSAVFQVPPVNAFGAITSNGIMGSLGDI